MTSKEIVKNTVIMTIIALVFGVILGVVHEVTLEPIRIQKELTLKAAYQAVMPAASDFKDLEVTAEKAAPVIADGDYNAQIDSVLEAVDANGESVGYVINVTSHGGYGGDIGFSMGVNADGSVEGVSITNIAETPGLGMKAQSDPSFLQQFLHKEGGTVFNLGENVTAITSATFTSRCVTRGVNAGLAYFNAELSGGAA